MRGVAGEMACSPQVGSRRQFRRHGTEFPPPGVRHKKGGTLMTSCDWCLLLLIGNLLVLTVALLRLPLNRERRKGRP